jgi:hypothetical protein
MAELVPENEPALGAGLSPELELEEIINMFNDRIKTPDLSDRQIMQLFGDIIPRLPGPIKTTTSGCWVATGHGDDLDIEERLPIIDEMAKLHEDFNTRGERTAMERYIKTVTSTMAMGLPGPSAPMGRDTTYGRWASLTSSEIDVQIIRNVYQLFNVFLNGRPATNDMLGVVNYIIKQQLRANFMRIWGRGGEFKLDEKGNWEADIVRLIKANEIWVTKKIKPDSADRYFQLKPNEGEDPRFRAREGLHLIDMRNKLGLEIDNLVLPIVNVRFEESRVPLPLSREFDKNNILFPEARARLDAYFLTLGYARGTKEEIVYNLIINKIYNKSEPHAYLSELIMLGYILKIDKLQIYDPLCRPLKRESVVSDTRSGTQFRGEIPAKEAADYETYPREGSGKFLKELKTKCERSGDCSVMGGKPRSRIIKQIKQIKKTTKSKRKTKQSTRRRKMSKRTRKYRRL